MKCLEFNSYRNIAPNPIVRGLDILCKNREGFRIETVGENLFRSSDVSLDRIPFLSKIGIKRVINLKTLSKKQYETLSREYRRFNIEFINIPVSLFNFKKSIPHIVEMFKDVDKKTTLCHCTYGKHRTGGVIALARKILHKKPMNQLIEEMYNHGFGRIHKIVFCSIKSGLKDFEKQKIKINA